jgi:hypothetical protein
VEIPPTFWSALTRQFGQRRLDAAISSTEIINDYSDRSQMAKALTGQRTPK